MKHGIKLIALFLFFILLPIKFSCAQKFYNSFVDWSIFSVDRGDKKICYIVSLPIKKDGNYDKRGEPYFVVTLNQEGEDEISTSSGYEYKKNSDVEISFGLKKFNIFTYGDLAWTYDRDEDLDIIKEMRINSDFSVSGININGSYSQDSYSLLGFVEAYNKMREICHE